MQGNVDVLMTQHDEATAPPSSRSRLSINDLCNTTATASLTDSAMSEGDGMDTSLVIATNEEYEAAAALGDLRSHRVDEPGLLPDSSSMVLTENVGDNTEVMGEDGFITRMSNIPLVKSTIRLYDQSKAHSRVVKYGAEMVESSVKTVSRPVLDRLEPQLGQLDEFACRQLDKLGNKYVSSSSAEGADYADASGLRQRVTSNNRAMNREEYQHQVVKTEACSSVVPVEQTSQLSRWQQILVEAGTAAGAGAAALSEEGMRSLKYCLEWLSYALRHIEQQIGILQAFIASLTDGSGPEQANDVAMSNAVTQKPSNIDALAAIKREIVETLRKVVEVMGRYAGACLPREARRAVRNFILSLPTRWASLSVDLSTNSSTSSSPCLSPLLTPTTPPPMTHGPLRLTPVESANRVFALATESLLMLNRVADVFGETKVRADTLVSHLRSVGYSPAGASTDEEVIAMATAAGYIDAYGRPVQAPADLLASRLQTVAQQAEVTGSSASYGGVYHDGQQHAHAAPSSYGPSPMEH